MEREGFVKEKDFAEMPASELTVSYLARIGITGKGVQMCILGLHKELQAKHDVVESPVAGSACATQTVAEVSACVPVPALMEEAPAPTAPAALVGVDPAPALVTLPTLPLITTAPPPATEPMAGAKRAVRTRIPTHALIPVPAAPAAPPAPAARMRSDHETQSILVGAAGASSSGASAVDVPVMAADGITHLLELRDKIDAALAKYAGPTATAAVSSAAHDPVVDTSTTVPTRANLTKSRNKRKLLPSDLESDSEESDGNEESSISAYDTAYLREKPKKGKAALTTRSTRKKTYAW